jgi:hypothetical protein
MALFSRNERVAGFPVSDQRRQGGQSSSALPLSFLHEFPKSQTQVEEVDSDLRRLCSFGFVQTGGGDVPALTWHIFDPDAPFQVAGIEVVPLPGTYRPPLKRSHGQQHKKSRLTVSGCMARPAVHHGKYFTDPPTPFYCLGFLFDRQLAYLSDVSYIPPEIYRRVAQYVRLPFTSSSSSLSLLSNGNGNGNGNANGHGEEDEDDEEKPRLKALIVDCLRVEPFASHFGIGQAVETARRLGAERNYLVRRCSPSLSLLTRVQSFM